MGDTGGCLCLQRCKEHKSQCRNTNPSRPLPCVSAAQLYLWLKASRPYLGETHAWPGLLDHVDEILLPPGCWVLPFCVSMWYVFWIPLVLSTDFTQHSASSGWVQVMKQGELPHHRHLPSRMLPLCTWPALGWRVENTVKGKLGVCCTAWS